MSDEVGLAAYVDVALVWAAAQTLVQRRTVAFLFTAVQVPDQDVIRSQNLVLTVSTEPKNEERKPEISFKNK